MITASNSFPQTAFIFAAGFGKRMLPLTEKIPKPLIEVAGKKLIDYSVDYLINAGFKKIIINAAYLADILINHLEQRNDNDVQILISEEPEPLETGGGLRHAMPLFAGESSLLLLNSDVIFHDESSCAVSTLREFWDPDQQDILLLLSAIDNSTGYRAGGDFLMEKNGKLSRRDNSLEKDSILPYVFTGMQVIKTSLIENETRRIFSLSDFYQNDRLDKVRGVEYVGGKWLHVGDIDGISEAAKIIKSG